MRRRLGPTGVPRLVFIDWMVLGAPSPFVDALTAMATPATTRHVVGQLAAIWQADLNSPAVNAYVEEMASYPDDMWARAAREISASFERIGSPLDDIAAFDSPPETLHLYAQPEDPRYFEDQRRFAAGHSWFHVQRLAAKSHFPMFEVADAMADHIVMLAVS